MGDMKKTAFGRKRFPLVWKLHASHVGAPSACSAHASERFPTPREGWYSFVKHHGLDARIQLNSTVVEVRYYSDSQKVRDGKASATAVNATELQAGIGLCTALSVQL